LIVAILLLKWHYLVDIIGGILVAGAAIAITGQGTFPAPAKPGSS
jgi:membrane-associated phospholipid phosphatase